ncbi:MAG: penicillin-binding protein [Actinomycetota bacterium]
MPTRTNTRGRPAPGIVTLLGALLGTSLIMGLLTAGLFMPFVGASGATASAGSKFFESLPAELEQTPLAQRSRILAADGSEIAVFYSENRTVVPLEKIAPVMREAQLAIEDERFYDHGGVDPKGIARAAVNNASGSSVQGASTITQQYVKLSLQQNALAAGDEAGVKAASEQTIARKMQEVRYAVALEQKMSKDQILEGYLNIAYYGDSAYGVEAAARRYFNVSASKLTLAQAATLAGIVQQPSRDNPRLNPKASLDRRNVVLSRMLKNEYITQTEHDKAVKSKLTLKISDSGNGCDTSEFAFFCNYVYQLLLQDKTFGDTAQARRELIFRGGLTITTSLDPKIQRSAQKAVDAKVAPTNKSKVATAISVVEPGTGKIVAMAQSRKYGRDTDKGQTVVNYNVDRAYGGGGGFQTGSTFKTFTLAAALESGKSLNDSVYSAPGGTTFQGADYNSSACWPAGNLAAEDFPMGNSEGAATGNVSIAEATAKSINTAYMTIAAETGICKVKDVVDRLGVHLGDPIAATKNSEKSDSVPPFPTMVIGASSIAPLTMAGAYAAFAADGLYCKPIAITAAKTVDGKAIKIPGADCKQVIDQNVARGVNRALKGVIDNGTAAGVEKIGRPAAGKTGTTNSNQNTWFLGYTPELSAAVWLGHPEGDRPLINVNTGKDVYAGKMYGSRLAAPLWADFMSDALRGRPVKNFGQPNDKLIFGDLKVVPNVVGQDLGQAQRILSEAGFGGQVGSPVGSREPAGRVGKQSPAGGTRVTDGTRVTIYPSIGIRIDVPTAKPTRPRRPNQD